MFTTLFSYLWAIWFGWLVWILIKHFLDTDFEKRKLLFEARTKAYSQLIWKIQNLFLPDLFKKESITRAHEFNIILSEARLLSSNELHEALWEYGSMAWDYFGKISNKSQESVIDMAKCLSWTEESVFRKKGYEIIKLMRKDLYLVK